MSWVNATFIMVAIVAPTASVGVSVGSVPTRAAGKPPLILVRTTRR